ncbi:PF06114 domain protein [Streptococcus oralis SK304]|jgi:hypothetical protein|uniref:PF06114 domain protein n=1 Tax=Streptococcus oralis SK304 TaxID=1161421 RepID=J4K9K2_STROR|nr:ImmA/IrrE family metallo-endopeptidase [Streptococcus oralis]EJP22916.1 PF06114 domain protein [Streptococcus oralis SK304]
MLININKIKDFKKNDNLSYKSLLESEDLYKEEIFNEETSKRIEGYRKAIEDVIDKNNDNQEVQKIDIVSIIKAYKNFNGPRFFKSSGMTVDAFYDSKGKKVYINKYLSNEDRHYACAHELAHYLFEDSSAYLDRNQSFSRPSYEAKANQFAYETLLPEKLLENIIIEYKNEKCDSDLNKMFNKDVNELIKYISDKTDVSEFAVYKRLKFLYYIY